MRNPLHKKPAVLRVQYLKNLSPERQLEVVGRMKTALPRIKNPTDAAKSLHRILWGDAQ